MPITYRSSRLAKEQPILRLLMRRRRKPVDVEKFQRDFWRHFDLEKFARDWQSGVGLREKP